MVGLASKGVRGFIAKTGYDEDGRVCISCDKYKKWQNFGKDMNGINNKTSSCKVCRREKKRQYREKYNREQDNIYREHKRTLYIGDIIEYDGKEYKVIEYRIGQGYRCKSKGIEYLNLSTSDNKKYKKPFRIIRYNMAIPKTLAIARVGRQILSLSKMTKVEKYYKIIDILTQFYDDNILKNTKDNEIESQEVLEENE